jgi:hypothetical protein
MNIGEGGKWDEEEGKGRKERRHWRGRREDKIRI